MKFDFPIEKISRFIPAVEKPTYKQTFNARLTWTGVALLLYIVLSHISVYGMIEMPELGALFTIQTLLGAKIGTLMTLGIGPIVTAGILLQLLTGSKIINWDMSDPDNRKKFQTWNKFLAIVLCFVEAMAFVLAGAIPVAPNTAIIAFVILQLAAGGIIVILLDDLVQKWGFGSGISLFIVAGVASTIFVRALSIFPTTCDPGFLQTCIPDMLNPPVGLVWRFFIDIFSNQPVLALVSLLPLMFTIIVFLIVIFTQSVGINIPLSFSSMRGFGRNWNLKLFYTSNIPVILAAALIANLQLMSTLSVSPVSNGISCGFLGCIDQNKNPVSGEEVGRFSLIYYLTPPYQLLTELLSLAFPDAIQGVTFSTSQIFRAITYTIFIVALCAAFSIFWVNTSGMDAGSVAEQIENTGMQIPGYRSDKRTMEGVLNRYIPPLALLGGLFVGLLAAFADFTGALGTGTGILLTVMITYQLYQQLSNENLEDAHPAVRKILGEE